MREYLGIVVFRVFKDKVNFLPSIRMLLQLSYDTLSSGMLFTYKAIRTRMVCKNLIPLGHGPQRKRLQPCLGVPHQNYRLDAVNFPSGKLWRTTSGYSETRARDFNRITIFIKDANIAPAASSSLPWENQDDPALPARCSSSAEIEL